MNSKECLERLFGSYVNSKCYGINYKKDDEDFESIKQDLDKLEKMEKAIKTLKEELEIANDIIKSQKFLRNSQKLEQENAKLKKTIEILKVRLELTLYHNKPLNTYSVELMCFEEHLAKHITQEEYKLLKEVVENE